MVLQQTPFQLLQLSCCFHYDINGLLQLPVPEGCPSSLATAMSSVVVIVPQLPLPNRVGNVQEKSATVSRPR